MTARAAEGKKSGRSNRRAPKSKPKQAKRRRARPRASAASQGPAEADFVFGDTPDPPAVEGVEPPSGWRRGASVLWSGAKLGLGVLIVVGLSLAVAWGAHRFALTTPRFSIEVLEVVGNRRLSDDRIGQLAGASPGDNLFAIEPDEAEARLLGDPWIQSVKVSRVLPATLRIELVEREARALAVIGEALYLLTPDGEPFKELEEGEPHDLPVVTGLTARGLALDRARELERARTAIEVLRRYETMPLARVHPLEEVHLQADGKIVLSLGQKPITVHLGEGSVRQKLLMAARVIAKVQASGEAPGIVFLDNQAHTERVVVRMR